MQVIADSTGQPVRISPTLPGARHDMGAPREHGIIDALNAAGVIAVADTAHQGSGPSVRVLQPRRRVEPDPARYRPLSRSQKKVNTAHAPSAARVSGSTPS